MAISNSVNKEFDFSSWLIKNNCELNTTAAAVTVIGIAIFASSFFVLSTPIALPMMIAGAAIAFISTISLIAAEIFCHKTENIDETTENIDETTENIDETTENIDETTENIDEIITNMQNSAFSAFQNYIEMHLKSDNCEELFDLCSLICWYHDDVLTKKQKEILDQYKIEVEKKLNTLFPENSDSNNSKNNVNVTNTTDSNPTRADELARKLKQADQSTLETILNITNIENPQLQPTGFNNFTGAACYYNSMLHVLLSLHGRFNMLKKKPISDFTDDQKNVLIPLLTLYKSYHTRNLLPDAQKLINDQTEKFFRILQKSPLCQHAFTNNNHLGGANGQQDFSEILTIILDAITPKGDTSQTVILHKYKREYIDDNKEIKECTPHNRKEPEPVNLLILSPNNQNITLTDAIRNSLIDSDWNTELRIEGKMRKIKNYSQFRKHSIPDELLIYVARNKLNRKDKSKILYKENQPIDLSEFFEKEGEQQVDARYIPTNRIFHLGGSNGGHYIASVKSQNAQGNPVYFTCNDSTVTGSPDSNISGDLTCLVLRRIKDKPEILPKQQ